MKKSLIITSMAAFAALCFTITAQAQGPVVVSDKDDYSPGETAMFSTTGFQPGELLDFSVAVSDDNGLWIPDIAWADVPADGSGNAEVDYVVPNTWANKSLQLTVMGLTSGLMATTTFTDAGDVHNVEFGATGVPFPTNVGPISGTNFTPSGDGPVPFGPLAFVAPTGHTNLLGTKPGTELTFTGFHHIVGGVGGHYELTSFALSPAGLHPGMLHDLNTSGGSGGYTTGGDSTGGAGPTRITANYTFIPDATPNSTPVITPMTPNVNLGQIVGCLDNNSVIGTSVAVAYSVSVATANTDYNVYATFNGGHQTLIATIHDADGNLPLSGITLSQNGQNLTFTGPGTQMLSYSTSVTATDTGTPALSDGPKTCPLAGSLVTVQVIYGNLTFLPPLSGQRNTKVKQGSGVPVKFTLMDGCNNFITTGNHTIDVAYASGSAPYGDPTVDDAGASAGDPGDTFRYDPTGMLWIFNLKTNNTYYLGNSYWTNVNLDDETTRQVQISIK